MKKSKGFIVITELLCLLLCSILLTSAAYSCNKALQLAAYENDLQECMRAAVYCIAGEEYTGPCTVSRQEAAAEGIKIMEVQAAYGGRTFNLVQARPD